METPHHLVADFSLCDAKHLSNVNDMGCLVRILVSALNLTAIGEPIIYKFPGEDSGITVSQILGESLLSIHTYPAEQCLYLDIFSCKKFDDKSAVALTRRFLGAMKTEFKIVERMAFSK